MAEELKKLVEQRQKEAADKNGESGQAQNKNQAPAQDPAQPRRGSTANQHLGDEK